MLSMPSIPPNGSSVIQLGRCGADPLIIGIVKLCQPPALTAGCAAAPAGAGAGADAASCVAFGACSAAGAAFAAAAVGVGAARVLILSSAPTLGTPAASMTNKNQRPGSTIPGSEGSCSRYCKQRTMPTCFK